MTRTLLLAALVLAATPALAKVHACDMDSDYDVSLSADAITFTREQGSPREVVMRQGRLSVNGVEVALDAADRERVRIFEHDARALVPEVRAIALDAVEIAFAAMTEVARGLAPDNPGLHEKLDRARADLVTQFDRPDDHFRIDEDAIEASVERLVGEITPTLVGEVTTAAIAAALSGDETKVKAIEQRAERMEQEIEAKVEARAQALEARADALCPRIAALDELDDALAYRLDDGSALELLSVRD